MKKVVLFILATSIITLSACGKDNSSSKADNIQKANKPLTSDSSVDSQVDETTSPQAKENASKYFPADFKEALEIETKRQEVLLTGCHADMDNATYEAFTEMKALYNIYCEKVKSKLDDSQKKAFENFLEKEKIYSMNFDMFTHKVLSQQVYAGGNASCSEAYNLMRTETMRMYCYYLQLNNKSFDTNELKNIFQNQFEDFMFFNGYNISAVDGKSLSELSKINAQYVPKLKTVLNSTSQAVFDDYNTSFDSYISATQKFEESIGLKSESCNSYAFCSKLNTAIICNLYVALKDMDYPDGMLDRLNGDVNKDEYMQTWN